jgi:uncharacterized membrane protein YobD (UPF0266 family)
MKTKTLLTVWLPRVLAIACIIFFGLFSLDVFSVDTSVSENIVGFLIQNIPTALLIIALVFAWKKPVIGGIIFVALGVFFTVFYNTYQRWDTFVLISLPLLLTGGLFILNISPDYKK